MAGAAHVQAIKMSVFRSLEELENAHNLLIVAMPTPRVPVKLPPGHYMRDVGLEYAVVVRDFRGRYRPGQLVEVSIVFPVEAGRRYLLAGQEAMRDGKNWNLFHEVPGAVPLPESIPSPELDSMNVDELFRRIIQAPEDSTLGEHERTQVRVLRRWVENLQEVES